MKTTYLMFVLTGLMCSFSVAQPVVYNNRQFDVGFACGQFSLYYALSTIGLSPSLRAIFVEAEPSPQGSSALDLLRVIESNGATGGATELESQAKLRELQQEYAVILWIRDSVEAEEENHFVCLASFSESEIVLYDGLDVRSVPCSQFEKLWDGFAILVRPTRSGSPGRVLMGIAFVLVAAVLMFRITWSGKRKAPGRKTS